MPNKRKLAKLQLKQLSKGKLNSNKSVQETLKYIKEKAELDKEDIDFNFEKIKNNDFEKLDDHDDDTRKLKPKKKRPEKRKAASEEQENNEKNKKMKIDSLKSPINSIPKKSKKNKYFFIAHPEALDKSDEKIAGKFVIDKEKIKSNQIKRLKKDKPGKNTKNIENKKKGVKNKTNKNKLWSLEECSSSEEDQGLKNSVNVKGKTLDITDIDKSFNLIKKIEVLPDGSKIEILVPEYIQMEEVGENEDLIEDSDLVKEEENSNNSDLEQETKKNKNSNKKEKVLVKDKLQASRFRYLNEMLYRQISSDSFEYFQNDKDAFTAYHEGFKSQIGKWPVNPLDEIIKYIKSKPQNLVVADFGCGEARLAQSIKNKVHSFDLVAVNEHVIECDMKNVPIGSDSCDIVVFCLSLMGKNVDDFVIEANRVLKQRGILKIAEVVSRIEDRLKFIRSIESFGFKLVSSDKKNDKNESKTNEYFYFFDFVKVSKPGNKKVEIKLQPCLYKKR